MNPWNKRPRRPGDDPDQPVRTAPTNPGLLTPHERLSGLGRILAMAIGRWPEPRGIVAASDPPRSCGGSARSAIGVSIDQSDGEYSAQHV